MKQNVIAAAFFGVMLPFAAAHSQSCHAADSVSAAAIAEVNSMMGPSDTLRNSLQVPLVSTNQIALVTTESTCARAILAVDSVVHATNPNAPISLPSRSLYVITVGTYTAIVDPIANVDGWVPLYFFDSAWNFVNTLIRWG